MAVRTAGAPSMNSRACSTKCAICCWSSRSSSPSFRARVYVASHATSSALIAASSCWRWARLSSCPVVRLVSRSTSSSRFSSVSRNGCFCSTTASCVATRVDARRQPIDRLAEFRQRLTCRRERLEPRLGMRERRLRGRETLIERLHLVLLECQPIEVDLQVLQQLCRGLPLLLDGFAEPRAIARGRPGACR